jgi:hypothetical protein
MLKDELNQRGYASIEGLKVLYREYAMPDQTTIEGACIPSGAILHLWFPLHGANKSKSQLESKSKCFPHEMRF